MIISFRLTLSCFALLGAVVLGQTSVFTSPLPTGVRLDAVGDSIELGSMPLNVVPAFGGEKAVVVLSGWREQGIQIADLKTRRVTQTLLQDGAFFGAAFSPDGTRLYVSGGNTDMLFVYTWRDGTATLTNKFVLAKTKTADGTGTSYPAGIAVATNGKFAYVAENVGDLDAFPPPFLTINYRWKNSTLRVFSALTTLGTPLDVALQELRMESFFPADEATRVVVNRLAEEAVGVGTVPVETI